jgi:mannose-1-phosphate guanylyltransferase
MGSYAIDSTRHRHQDSDGLTPRGRDQHLWAIVLAAGEGTRLSAVTTAVHGHSVPKQFAAILGTRTFLQRTMDRIAPLVPPRRTLVVIAEGQLGLATEQLAAYPGVQIVVQPRNRGTGAGVLFPLAQVLAKDPRAYVAIFPSDHHVERESRFIDAVKNALVALPQAPAGVVLVGAAAESAATDLGWIACAGRTNRDTHEDDDHKLRPVERFVEKPGADRALELLKAGALWNTLILAARGSALWDLFAQKLPEVESPLRSYRDHLVRHAFHAAAQQLLAAYAAMPGSDLSRDVLEGARGLGAVAMIDAGWSDCGTPERLGAVLRRTVETTRAASADEVHARTLRALRQTAPLRTGSLLPS